MTQLPPELLPALDDVCFPDGQGPYRASGLREVCGTRINPDSIGWYKHKSHATSMFCAAKTCAHPELDQWLGDVRSFDPRSAVRQPALAEMPMTAIMPRLVVWGNELAFPLEPMTYVISYRYIHSNPHELPTRPMALNLKERFPEGSQLLLSFLGGRALTLGLWTLPDFWYADFLDNFDGIIMPDFSAFSDDPVPQYLLGERMQQIFAQEGSEAGRNVIPSIAWSHEESLRRQIELWTSGYPSVNTIHIDCDGCNVDKTGWTWRWLFAMEKYCQGQTHIRWLISGIGAGWAIRELNEIFPAGNYQLIPSTTLFISALKLGNPEQRARKFQSGVRRYQDLRAGREVADRAHRPDAWPKFSDVKKTRES